MITSQTIQILLFLLPGFLCYTIVRIVARTGNIDGLYLTANALIFALLIQFGTTLLPKFIVDGFGVFYFRFNVDGNNTEAHLYGINIISAILVGLACSASIKHDFHMKILRFLHITNKTSRMNVWSDIFSDTTGYVCINYNDGTQLQGLPAYFSDTKDEGIIVLAYASWRDADGNVTEVPNAMVMIPDLKEIISIDFQKPLEKKRRAK